MLDYIKEHSGTIFVVIGVFAFGVSAGIYCQADEDGLYMTLNFPNGNTMFNLGTSKTSISKLDVAALSSSDIDVIISKISKTSNTNEFGQKIRDLANRGKGPFSPIPVDLDVHLVSNDPKVTGPVAMACINSPILGNTLIAYEFLDSDNVPQSGIMDIHPVRTKQSCHLIETNNYSVWLNKQYAEKEFGISSSQGDKLTIKANMVLSILSF